MIGEATFIAAVSNALAVSYLMLVAVGLVLGALGNRFWGWEHGNRAIGVFLMTAGIVMLNPDLAIYTPVFAALIWWFRFMGTGETWLAFQEGRNRNQAILRGAAVLPLGVFITYLTGEWWHMAVAFAFPVIAFFYYFCGKTKAKDPTAYAELLAGAYLVSLTA